MAADTLWQLPFPPSITVISYLHHLLKIFYTEYQQAQNINQKTNLIKHFALWSLIHQTTPNFLCIKLLPILFCSI